MNRKLGLMMRVTLTTLTIYGIIEGLNTNPVKGCDSIGPIVVDENGNHIVTTCFTAPDPEPPEDREGSGEMTFEAYLKEWCLVNGDYLNRDYVNGDYYVCSGNQYYRLRETWVENGGIIR